MSQDHFCTNHLGRKALSFCHNCQNYYCAECLKAGAEYYYCQDPKCLQVLEAELHLSAPSANPSEATEPLPEDLVDLALYPNSAEARKVQAGLEAEGLKVFLSSPLCGQIEEPFMVPAGLRVREADKDKADEILKGLISAGHPESVSVVMGFNSERDAEEAQAKLASEGLQSFLWDSITESGNRFSESFCLLTRDSDFEKATGLLIVPETE
jgi:hypothetical protein